MTNKEILSLRLSNQNLTSPHFSKPEDVVSLLCAMQAQDYTGAKWALGQRLLQATDETIEKSFGEGQILRTHVMRPTWHFVSPKDIRGMLKLTAPRVKRIMSYYNRQLELDEKLFEKTNNLLEKHLDKKFLTRTEIKAILTDNGIKTNTQRLGHIVMWAELDAIICSGPRIGKQFTYALLDDRVPKTKNQNSEEALVELTKRYFMSHGPATIQDFVWWSGLTTQNARKGLVLVGDKLNSETIEGKTYLFENSKIPKMSQKVFLLPNYDEIGIAYKYRDLFFDKSYIKQLGIRGNANFQHMILFEGKIVGTWSRKITDKKLSVSFKFFEKASSKEQKAAEMDASAYAKFLNLV